jgi:hypothetical protein
MEKFRRLTKKSRKGGLALAIILSCFLVLYWFIKNNNYNMTTTTKSVRGVLYNAATGQPVEGAMVMIAEGTYEHQDIAAQSDAQGSFYLPEIKVPGTYTLLINYNDQSRRITVNITSDSVLRLPL